MNYEKELNAAIEAGLKAKEVILNYYYHGFHVEIKEDASPVTEADKESDRIIREYLGSRFPTYAFLTEESIDDKSRLQNDYCWIIDPVDGTKDFVMKDDEFTINIALAYKHEVVLGVVFIPARNEIYYATKDSRAYKIDENGKTKKIQVNDKLTELTVLKSRYHSKKEEEEIYKKYASRIKNIEGRGSSLKACLIAEGKAELTYRKGDGTKEWDTAAFQIIVEEAGGLVLDYSGKPLKYNREDVYNHDGYVVMNRKENYLI